MEVVVDGKDRVHVVTMRSGKVLRGKILLLEVLLTQKQVGGNTFHLGCHRVRPQTSATCLAEWTFVHSRGRLEKGEVLLSFDELHGRFREDHESGSAIVDTLTRAAVTQVGHHMLSKVNFEFDSSAETAGPLKEIEFGFQGSRACRERRGHDFFVF